MEPNGAYRKSGLKCSKLVQEFLKFDIICASYRNF